MGVESAFEGIIDLITMKAHYFEGPSGEQRKIVDIPAKYLDEAKEKNAELTEKLADVDDAFAEIVLNEQTPTEADYKAAIRRATIALKFAPVMMVKRNYFFNLTIQKKFFFPVRARLSRTRASRPF